MHQRRWLDVLFIATLVTGLAAMRTHKIASPASSTPNELVEPARAPYVERFDSSSGADEDAEPADHATGISVCAVRRHHEIVGYRITFPSGDRNVYSRLGIERGDVLLRLQNHPLRGPEDLQWACSQVRDADELRFTVERRGRVVVLQGKFDGKDGAWRCTEALAGFALTTVWSHGTVTGYRVTLPDEDNPFARFGFREGDVLLRYQGRPFREFYGVWRDPSPNTKNVEVTVERNGKRFILSIPRARLREEMSLLTYT